MPPPAAPRRPTHPLVRVAWALVRLPLFAINWTGVAVFYMLAFTKFIRYSDMMNDLRGMNGAVISMHQYVVPFVNMQTISAAYGTPIALSTLDLADTGASMRMRLSASTAELNIPKGPGSATFFSNWAMSTLNVTTAKLPALCDLARNSTGFKYEQFNTSTVVQHKPNVDGGELNLWAGVKHLPTTIKATTQVVSLKVTVNKPSQPATSGCLYRMKMYHSEAFELWNPEMATFNILTTDFQINETAPTINVTATPLAWIFDPRVSRLNWFFYRRQSPELNFMSLVSQLVGFALLFSSGRRVISLKTKQRSAQTTCVSSSSSNGRDSDVIVGGEDIEVTVTKRIAHHEVDPSASQGLYYNSLIINVCEVFIIMNDRYMIFRCINALDFFMTAGWGFNTTNMWIEYINIMGSIFWLILGLHKLLSLMIYVVSTFMWKCSKRMRLSGRISQYSVQGASGYTTVKTSKVTTEDNKNSRLFSMNRKYTEMGLVVIKEATRPRPDLIVLLMMLFPKFFYAHFFGGATAWAAVDLPTTSSLASNLGANLLIANTFLCGFLIFPLNAIFVLASPRHILGNGWIQLRKPVRVYYQRMTFCHADHKEYSFDEGKIDSLLTLLVYQAKHLLKHRGGRHRYLAEESSMDDKSPTSKFPINSSAELCVTLRFHDILHDSLIGEIQALYGIIVAEDVDKAYARYVEHAPCANPFRYFPVVVIAEYGNRGVLLTWPGVATSIRGINNMDFTRMFLGRIHLIGADFDPRFIEKQVVGTK